MQKKIRNLLLIAITLFVCNIGKVDALETSAYCVYFFDSVEMDWPAEGIENNKLTEDKRYVEFIVNQAGLDVKPDLLSSAEGEHIFYTQLFNFVTDNRVMACPKKLYVEIVSKPIDDEYKWYVTGNIPSRRYSFNKNDLNINSGHIFEGLLTTDSATYTAPEGFSPLRPNNMCRYDDVYLTYGDGKYRLGIAPKWTRYDPPEDWKQVKPSVQLGNGLGYSDLPQSCPSQIYVSTDNVGNKTVYLNPTESSTKVELSPILSATALGFYEGINIDESAITDRSAGCAIFGEHLSPIIQWVIDLIQIAVPLLIIILTIVDFVGIVLSGEEKNFKAAGTKFIKRIVIGVAVIFLPMLITFIIDLSGVLVPYGIDKNQLFCSLF